MTWTQDAPVPVKSPLFRGTYHGDGTRIVLTVLSPAFFSGQRYTFDWVLEGDLLTFSHTRVIPPNPEAQKGVRCDYALNPWRLVSAAGAHGLAHRTLPIAWVVHATALLRWPESVRGGASGLVGWVSDGLGQFGEGVGKAGTRRYVGPEVVEPPAEVLDEGVAGDDDPCGAVSLQSAHRSDSGLQATVVGFEGVVRVGLRSVPGGWEHSSITLG